MKDRIWKRVYDKQGRWGNGDIVATALLCWTFNNEVIEAAKRPASKICRTEWHDRPPGRDERQNRWFIMILRKHWRARPDQSDRPDMDSNHSVNLSRVPGLHHIKGICHIDNHLFHPKRKKKPGTSRRLLQNYSARCAVSALNAISDSVENPSVSSWLNSVDWVIWSVPINGLHRRYKLLQWRRITSPR
jgi:hypothetical protein